MTEALSCVAGPKSAGARQGQVADLHLLGVNDGT